MVIYISSYWQTFKCPTWVIGVYKAYILDYDSFIITVYTKVYSKKGELDIKFGKWKYTQKIEMGFTNTE